MYTNKNPAVAAGLCKTCFLGNFFRFSVLDVLGFQGLDKNGFRLTDELDFSTYVFDFGGGTVFLLDLGLVRRRLAEGGSVFIGSGSVFLGSGSFGFPTFVLLRWASRVCFH